MKGRKIDEKGLLEPNIMVFQTFAYLAATKLKDSSNRVLMLFLAKSGYENYIGMDIKSIEEELKMSKRTVQYAIGELSDLNIIIKVETTADKRRNEYFINPIACWKGNSWARQKSMKKLKENKEAKFQETTISEIVNDIIVDYYNKTEL